MVISYELITLAVSLLGLMLSMWVVLPAPTSLWLSLSVGAPEVSPWLAGMNLLAFGLSLPIIPQSWLGALAGLVSAIALTLSLIPVAQFSGTHQRAQTAMVTTLGPNYLANDPANPAAMRPAPLVLPHMFWGMPNPTVRLITGVTFAKPNGQPLTLDVYQPPAAGVYPAIAILYGGAWQRGSPKDNAPLARHLAAQGYVVWALSYRHAPAHQFPAQLNDVQAALAFIHKHARKYESDPNRIALLGKSAGAHLAMLAAFQPDAPPVRAVINYYGPINLLNGYYDLPHPDPIKVRSVLETFLNGNPDTVEEQYHQASPSTYLRPGLPPTLLLYGRKDRIVMAKFGQSLAQNLHAHGNIAILIEIPWADHAFDAIFRGLSNQLTLYYMERFLGWALK